MSDSLRPHGLQPTRLLCPWDSPGKNTGVDVLPQGSNLHLLCLLHWQVPTRLLRPWGFSSQECWSGLPCPPPRTLPNPGIESRSPALQADSIPSEPPGKPKNTGVGSLSLLQHPGIESRSLTSFILAGAFLTTSSTLHVLLSYKDLCSVNQSQGLLKVDENLELRVKWIWR